jgi:hypothetical protein
MMTAMMARMGAPRVKPDSSVERLAKLVDPFARQVAPAILEQQGPGSVSSALGVWLLLAASVSAASGSERAELEEVLGCPAEEASRLLAAFMAAPPQALHAPIALWVAVDDATAALAEWTQRLPDEIQSGFMPTQADADAWAERETQGLIRRFPLEIDRSTRVVLASALATKVRWEIPFGVVPAAEHCGPDSPWRGAVSQLLWDDVADGHAEIAQTEAAGVVAVHCANASNGLAVVSVSAAPDVDRASVVAAAYEVAESVCGDWGRGACSLFDLPLGAGHSWQISEHEVAVFRSQPRLERIVGAALPAWRAADELDLTRSSAFGTAPALHTLRRLIGPRPTDETAAKQTVMAAFGRYGFEAAAVTAFGVRTSAALSPRGRAVERRAVLRFDHPYAAVAIAGRVVAPRGRAAAPSPAGTSFPGLPLFCAWVHEPAEPEARARLTRGRSRASGPTIRPTSRT